MKPAPQAVSLIDAFAAQLAEVHNAQGDLELMLVRRIASAQITNQSLQRAIVALSRAKKPNDARIGRFREIHAHNESRQSTALRELQEIQDRRAHPPRRVSAQLPGE